MRTLYRKFYKEKKRGFTDQEFRDVCESTAGGPLAEIFDVYAPTVKDIDYAKYLAYGGLDIDVQPRDLPGTWFGAAAQDQNGRLAVTGVEFDSPASKAGLSVQDEIVAIDGVRASARSISELTDARKPGDRVRVSSPAVTPSAKSRSSWARRRSEASVSSRWRTPRLSKP